MKKYFYSFIIVMCSFLLVGCGCMKMTAKGSVEEFLSQYKDLSSNVLEDMEKIIKEEDITDEQKEVYRSILKRQYQDIKYEIKDERYNKEEASVDVLIKVYDLYKVQEDANRYYEEHPEEFKSNKEFIDYKLEKMKTTKEIVEYNITFNLSKDDKGNYKITNVSKEDLEKIHGIYNYDNE